MKRGACRRRLLAASRLRSRPQHIGHAHRPRLVGGLLANPAGDHLQVHQAHNEQDGPVGDRHEHRSDGTPRDHAGEHAHAQQEREEEQQARQRQNDAGRPEAGEEARRKPRGKDEQRQQGGHEEQRRHVGEHDQLPAGQRPHEQQFERALANHGGNERSGHHHAHEQQDRAADAVGEELLEDEHLEPERRAFRAGEFEAVAKEREAVGPEDAKIGPGIDREFPGLATHRGGHSSGRLADLADRPEATVGDLAKPARHLVGRREASHDGHDVSRERHRPRRAGAVDSGFRDRLRHRDHRQRAIEPTGHVGQRVFGEVDAGHVGRERAGGQIEVAATASVRLDAGGEGHGEEHHDCREQ